MRQYKIFSGLTMLALSYMLNIPFAHAQESGIITEMDLQSRDIEIDKHPFSLADTPAITSPSGGLTSQAALIVGQKIDYWTTPVQDSTKAVITKIQIKTLFDEKVKK